MRYPRNSWPKVVDRLFSMERVAAEEEIRTFHKWVVERRFSLSTTKALTQFRLQSLSRMLRERGAVMWEIKRRSTQRAEDRWAQCHGDFKVEADKWLRELRLHLEPGTIASYQNGLLEYGMYLARHGIHHLDLKKCDAIGWLEELRSRQAVPTRFNLLLRMAQLFHEHLRSQDLTNDNPLASFKMQRIRRKLPQLLTEREMARLIGAAQPGRNRAIVEMLYASGCRLSELRGMDIDKISFSEGTARSVGKGGHDRVLYLNQSALGAIQDYLPKRLAILKRWGRGYERALFISYRGNRLGQTCVKEIIGEARRKIGLNKRVTPHLFRHSFATHLLNRGADIYSLSQLLGHKSISSTIVYLQIATERLSAVHRKFHPRK